MPAEPRSSRSIALTLPRDLEWVLHHVLLDRIDGEPADGDAPDADPPPLELYRAFEVLDAGEACFTAEQLEAMQEVLAAYQRATDEWELERSEIERLLRRVSTSLESLQSTPTD